jgi:hypothetical protein
MFGKHGVYLVSIIHQFYVNKGPLFRSVIQILKCSKFYLKRMGHIIGLKT